MEEKLKKSKSAKFEKCGEFDVVVTKTILCRLNLVKYIYERKNKQKRETPTLNICCILHCIYYSRREYIYNINI